MSDPPQETTTVITAEVGKTSLSSLEDDQCGKNDADTPNLVARVQNLISTDAHVGWPVEHPGYAPLKHGWFFQSHQDVLKHLISAETTCIIEIGSWLGRSTEYFAKTAPNAAVFAIDLWDDEVILNDTHYNSSAENMAILKSGPLYDRFLSNMWEYRSKVSTQSALTETNLSPGIIPMKMDGCAGVAILKALDVVPDLVYIDASHHYESVVEDISTVLRVYPSADIVGDDWDYPDVQRAVKVCAQKFNLEIHVAGYKCWTYSKQKCEERSRESRKRERAAEEERHEGQMRESKIKKMSLKELMGQYKKKK